MLASMFWVVWSIGLCVTRGEWCAEGFKMSGAAHTNKMVNPGPHRGACWEAWEESPGWRHDKLWISASLPNCR